MNLDFILNLSGIYYIRNSNCEEEHQILLLLGISCVLLVNENIVALYQVASDYAYEVNVSHVSLWQYALNLEQYDIAQQLRNKLTEVEL